MNCIECSVWHTASAQQMVALLLLLPEGGQVGGLPPEHYFSLQSSAGSRAYP